MSLPASKAAISDEPACWGSGERELIPVTLLSAVKGVQVSGLLYSSKRKSKAKTKSKSKSQSKSSAPMLFDPDLSGFASDLWTKFFGQFTIEDPELTLLDVVIATLEKVFNDEPDRLDVPILNDPLDRVDHALSLPFEVRTWGFVFESGVETDHDVCTLLTGSFRELVQRLGDMRAALDVAVTGASWLVPNSNGSFGFAVPEMPTSFDEAVDLLRLRRFRTCGWKPSSPQYASHYAELMGKRWSIGLSKPWTLQQSSESMGLSRERIRQVELNVLWDSAPRMWGRAVVLDEIYEQLVDLELQSIRIEDGSVDRQTAIDVMTHFGYPSDEFEPPWSVADELELHGIKWSEIVRVAYGESEKLGLITQFELRHHIAEKFPLLVGEMFDDVIEQLVMFNDLPHGYVYLESRNLSSIKSWLVKLIGVLGPQSFDETYKALARFCVVRAPRLVFPPRPVVRALLERHRMFWVADDVVGLQSPFQQEIDGVEKWLRTQIESCTGSVIHKTELWDRARQDGIKGGTLNVYTSYHLLFRPCGSGCITITGHQPSTVAIELAQIRARAIRVPTRRGVVKVVDGVVLVPFEVGNDLLDTGVMNTTKELRQMIQDEGFAIISNGDQHGNVGWSNGLMTGFSSVLQAMGVEPGDRVLFSFDVASREALITYDIS